MGLKSFAVTVTALSFVAAIGTWQGYLYGKRNQEHLSVAIDVNKLGNGVCKAMLVNDQGKQLIYAEKPVDPIIEAVLPNGCEVKKAWIALEKDNHGIPAGTLGSFTYYACQPRIN